MASLPLINGDLLSTADMSITTNDGENLHAIHALTYNATISAVEIRAYRPQTERALPDLASRGPLRVFAMGGLAYSIHYEAVTYVPIEFDVGEQIVTTFERPDGTQDRVHDCAARELHVLRCARIEVAPKG